MIKNYILLILRRFKRNLLITSINLIGLSLGIASSALIFLYVKHELSYDDYHQNKERIYRVGMEFQIGDATAKKVYHTSFAMGPILKEEYSEIAAYTRMAPLANKPFYQYGDLSLYGQNCMYADSNFFEVFDVKFINGDQNALKNKNSIVLCEDIANKLFGDEDPIGKEIKINNRLTCTVTALVEDLPKNSNLNFQALVDMASMEFQSQNFWNLNVISYILLNDQNNVTILSDKWPAFYEKYMSDLGEQVEATADIIYQPLLDVYLNSNDYDYGAAGGSYMYIYSFGAIALFLILIAAINYMNLTTSRASLRSKEVAVRKVNGASKKQLRRQFLSESIGLSFVAMFLGVVIIELALPIFNDLTRLDLNISNLGWSFYGFLILMTLLIGLFAGSYPAYFLASISPKNALKSNANSKGAGGVLRKVLVTTQFSLSVIVLICTIVVHNQLRYMENKDLGYDHDNVLLVSVRDSTIAKHVEAFNAELRTLPEIEGVGLSSAVAAWTISFSGMCYVDSGMTKTATMNIMNVDAPYFELMNYELLDGRTFDPESEEDKTNKFIINETAARMLGTTNPVGLHLGWPTDSILNNLALPKGEVIGLVKDFQYGSFHREPIPIVMAAMGDRQNRSSIVHIKTKQDQLSEVIRLAEEKWADFGAVYPFEYNVLDEELADLHRKEGKLAQLFNYFSGLCILISCLGLFGLAAFTIERRTKEIGVRKVMGATLGQLIIQIIKDFLKLIGLATIIAWPIAWFVMNSWLEDFTSHIDLNLLPFVQSAVIVIFITIITTGYHTLKAAWMNPIKALRYE
ncbi:MAG: ABC transporter permease [Flavobacteriales bacterium]|nr:ABC transporter permease [Flavobacteriales bacterium]